LESFQDEATLSKVVNQHEFEVDLDGNSQCLGREASRDTELRFRHSCRFCLIGRWRRIAMEGFRRLKRYIAKSSPAIRETLTHFICLELSALNEARLKKPISLFARRWPLIR